MIKMNCRMKFPTIRDRKMSYGVNFILLFGLVLLSFFAQAKEIPKKTRFLVNDYAHVLSDAERRALEQKLVAYDDTTSTQIAVVIEKSTEGDDIFDYAIRLAEKWGIGQEGKDNGVLIYIATEDRKLRILTGYGAEPTLTDAMAKRIIERILIPAIRKGNYYEGLDKATTKIIQLTAGEFSADDEGGGIEPILIFALILLLFFLFVYLASKGNGGKGGGYYR
ncbi:MAG TPA: TPM domain-containing protein, partial [Saprospiraceae bacterium]|nr:TPM domain-containing protein [Saprospiraceae bacterium]